MPGDRDDEPKRGILPASSSSPSSSSEAITVPVHSALAYGETESAADAYPGSATKPGVEAPENIGDDTPFGGDRLETAVDALPAGARAIDPLASIHDPGAARLAAQVRAEALARSVAATSDGIDVNATIISKRAASAAEHARDTAFDKLRDGSADDLRETVAIRRSPVSEDPRRASDQDGQWFDQLATYATSGREDIPPLDEADQALVAQLRALPAEGTEPDWHALEAGIRRATSRQPVAMPWWRDLRYLVPIATVAATLLIVVVANVMGSRPGQPAARDVAALPTPERAAVRDVEPQLWLDGEAVDISGVAAADLDAVGAFATATLASDEPTDSVLLESAGHGAWPVTDFTWLEQLDDAQLAAIESHLTRARP